MNKVETLILCYFDYLESKGPEFNAIFGLLCTVMIGTLDTLSPDAVKHSYLYIMPIAFVTWFSGMRLGLVISLLCTIFWSINNISESLIITAWNLGTTFIFFAAMTALLKKTRILWEKEKNLSRTDPLTGAKNLRAFSELVDYEILHSERDGLPFSLAYLDIDNFKEINDTFGHTAGDELLSAIVNCVVKNLRKTDVVGRLGGDEFALFFPETDQPAAQLVMRKINQELIWMMNSSPSPTTFSVGVITCSGGVEDFNKLISVADSLMYEVKHAGKNNIRYAFYPPPTI